MELSSVIPLSNAKNRISTALLLAAGTGSRLYPLTENSPKCLTLVNEISILERLITSLNQHGFERLVVVTGHLENRIRKFLGNRAGNLSIEYVYSPSYKTTNNIYSLWMAREIINEPFLLIESDLIFDPSLLTDMLYPDRIAISRMQSCLNGSTVTIDQFNKVEAFHNDAANHSSQTRYKTVNIYSLSLSSWYGVIEKLNQYILAGKVNNYYEAVFGQMVVEKRLSFQAVFFDSQPWCEIDTIEDLASAERMFSSKYRESFPYHDINIPILEKASQPVLRTALKRSVHGTS